MSARAKRPLTLPGLLTGWRKFVEAVETGYTLTGYDYVNDLSTRDSLEELLIAAREPLGPKLTHEIVTPLDERFRAATRALPRPLRLGGSDQARWWWFRVPNDLTGELAADLLGDT